ncbi:DinB family protein [Cytobacillus solani]|uniref:Damage-inducible protein DinB n=1 Tax=Cytobacillus solani TaxID=1637975 RepID=A0A0Q3VF25_9BACI|nr:DinB family protein [Cytobacillus solani]KOP71190.1 damage-inducible protein DinB [Bacillus sp. FJAT-21945]KQL17866.1 damage-inducible protein DinB [Cytobacillus solani]USK55684.1 DinB family protein [Cytobacillus solani]
MKALFQYNWLIREDWYQWCEDVEEEELLLVRTGGVGGILHTLFHIIDVEWSWIRLLQGKPDFQESFEEYKSLQKVRELDAKFRVEVEEFVRNWDLSMESNLLHDSLPDGRTDIFTWGEVMRHVIAHEIHHIGQISVWAREIGKKPVSANFIRREIIPLPEQSK